ncbi:MAG: hypothetical protein AB7Q97_19930 [Gammaproteobacteria bacterium]
MNNNKFVFMPRLPRWRRCALALAIGACACAPAAQAVDFTWLGGTGNFNASNWTSAGFPNATTADVFIDGARPGDSIVNLNIGASVGNLTIDAGDTFNVLEGRILTLGGNALNNNGTLMLQDTLNNSGRTGLLFNVDATLAGTGLTRIDSAGGLLDAFIDTSASSVRTLTIGTGQTVAGDGRIGGQFSTSFKVVNRGTVRAEGGTLQLTLSDANATPGLDNTGGVIAIAAGGQLRLGGGTVHGGSVQGSGGMLLGSGTGTLRDLSLTGSIDVAEGNFIGIAGTLTNNGALTLLDTLNNGSRTGLQLNADATLAGSGTTRIDSAGNLLDAFIDSTGTTVRTLTIGAGHTVAGDGRIGGVLSSSLKLANRGTLRAEGTLRVTTTGADGFVNQGAVEIGGASTLTVVGVSLLQQGAADAAIRLDGTLTASLVDLRDGTLGGTGIVAGSVLNAAHVGPGNSAGVLTVNGAYSQAASGVLDIELASLVQFDWLDVNGTATLAGMLALHCLGTCELAVGDSLTILDANPNNLLGEFSAVKLFGFATGKFDVVYDRALGDVRLLVIEATSAVPLPAAAWLMLGAIPMLGMRRRVRGVGRG